MTGPGPGDGLREFPDEHEVPQWTARTMAVVVGMIATGLVAICGIVGWVIVRLFS
jgi:hypothetical protein